MSSRESPSRGGASCPKVWFILKTASHIFTGDAQTWNSLFASTARTVTPESWVRQFVARKRDFAIRQFVYPLA